MTKYFFYYAHNILIINKTIFYITSFYPYKNGSFNRKKRKNRTFL